MKVYFGPHCFNVMFCHNTRLSLNTCQKYAAGAKNRLRLHPKSGASRRLRLRNTGIVAGGCGVAGGLWCGWGVVVWLGLWWRIGIDDAREEKAAVCVEFLLDESIFEENFAANGCPCRPQSLPHPITTLM